MTAVAPFGDQLDELNVWWPQGDGDALRAAAAAWIDAAELLDEMLVVLDAVAASIADAHHGDAAKRFTDVWDRWSGPSGYLRTTIADCRRLAESLAGFGTDVDVADCTIVLIVEQALQEILRAVDPAVAELWHQWLHDNANIVRDGLGIQATNRSNRLGAQAMEPNDIVWPDPGTPNDLSAVATAPVDLGAGPGQAPPVTAPPAGTPPPSPPTPTTPPTPTAPAPPTTTIPSAPTIPTIPTIPSIPTTPTVAASPSVPAALAGSTNVTVVGNSGPVTVSIGSGSIGSGSIGSGTIGSSPVSDIARPPITLPTTTSPPLPAASIAPVWARTRDVVPDIAPPDTPALPVTPAGADAPIALARGATVPVAVEPPGSRSVTATGVAATAAAGVAAAAATATRKAGNGFVPFMPMGAGATTGDESPEPRRRQPRPRMPTS